MKHLFISILTAILIISSNSCNADSKPKEAMDSSDKHSNYPTIAFIQSEQILGDSRSFGLAVADVDLDGDNDVFFSNYIGPCRLWINDGTGNFTMSDQEFGSAASSAHDADLADLNGDTFPDIFVVNHDEPSRTYFNNGDNTFSVSGQLIGTVGDYPQTIQLIDVDNDGDRDAYIYNIDAPNRLWLNDGTGNFMMNDIDYGGSNSNRQVLADLNGDSSPDLYISYRDRSSEIWYNDGLGNFTNSGFALGHDTDNINFADIDGDGDTDIIEANADKLSAWINQNNTGSFIAGQIINVGAFRCKFFDADLDNDYDLITSGRNSGTKLWLNDGSGSFTDSKTSFGETIVFCMEISKLDTDNDFDLVFGGMEGTDANRVFFNKSTP